MLDSLILLEGRVYMCVRQPYFVGREGYTCVSIPDHMYVNNTCIYD